MIIKLVMLIEKQIQTTQRSGIVKKGEIIYNLCYYPGMATAYVLVNIFLTFFQPSVSLPIPFLPSFLPKGNNP